MLDSLSEIMGQRFSDAKPNAATYDVHGVVTKVYADDHLLALAIQDFLRPFRGLPGAEPDIEFYLLTRPDGNRDAGGSFRAAELLYDWKVLRYSREGQLRYQEVPGAGSVSADLDAGLAVAFVDSGMSARAWSVAHVIFFPIWAQLLKVKGLFPVHAAGMERQGCGILFPGRSGSGKSTLSLQLLRHGFRLLGDDTVFVKADSHDGADMLFFPEEVDVCPETVDLFPQLALARNLAEDRWQPKTRVNLGDVRSSQVIEAAGINLLAFPVIARDGRTRYERIGQTEALAELILYAFLFMDPETSKENFGLLAGLVRRAGCFRLHMGLDGDELAKNVDELVARV